MNMVSKLLARSFRFNNHQCGTFASIATIEKDEVGFCTGLPHTNHLFHRMTVGTVIFGITETLQQRYDEPNLDLFLAGKVFR